jgi:hypothetical protein
MVQFRCTLVRVPMASVTTVSILAFGAVPKSDQAAVEVDQRCTTDQYVCICMEGSIHHGVGPLLDAAAVFTYDSLGFKTSLPFGKVQRMQRNGQVLGLRGHKSQSNWVRQAAVNANWTGRLSYKYSSWVTSTQWPSVLKGTSEGLLPVSWDTRSSRHAWLY